MKGEGIKIESGDLIECFNGVYMALLVNTSGHLVLCNTSYFQENAGGMGLRTSNEWIRYLDSNLGRSWKLHKRIGNCQWSYVPRYWKAICTNLPDTDYAQEALTIGKEYEVLYSGGAWVELKADDRGEPSCWRFERFEWTDKNMFYGM